MVVVAVPLLDKLRIDDVVGAIPVHLLAGAFRRANPAGDFDNARYSQRNGRFGDGLRDIGI